jgi:hypothetical protein
MWLQLEHCQHIEATPNSAFVSALTHPPLNHVRERENLNCRGAFCICEIGCNAFRAIISIYGVSHKSSILEFGRTTSKVLTAQFSWFSDILQSKLLR